MHKRWIQAIFLCHQLRQIFLLFHSADFGQSTGEAQGSARSDAGSRGSAQLPRCSAYAAARVSPRVLTGPCTEHLRLLPSGCAAQSPHLPVPSVVPRQRRSPLTQAALTGEAGTEYIPLLPTIHWQCAMRGGAFAKAPSFHWAELTSESLTGRRQLQRGGERRRYKRFLLAAQTFPGYQACPVVWSPRSSAEVPSGERAGKAPVKQRSSGPRQQGR